MEVLAQKILYISLQSVELVFDKVRLQNLFINDSLSFFIWSACSQTKVLKLKSKAIELFGEHTTSLDSLQEKQLTVHGCQLNDKKNVFLSWTALMMMDMLIKVVHLCCLKNILTRNFSHAINKLKCIFSRSKAGNNGCLILQDFTSIDFSYSQNIRGRNISSSP